MASEREVKAAAVYCRISNDRDGEGLGVARQKELCLERARKEGWPVARYYIDNDQSAYSGKRRPQYEQLLEDIESSDIDAVVFLDHDRLTRSPSELEGFLKLVDRHQLQVANVSGPLDLSSSDGRAMAGFHSVIARWEVEKKSERLKRQRDQAARQGLPHGGRRPFGFEADGMTLRHQEAALAVEAVDRVLTGESLRSVAQDWNERGITTATGKKWRTTSLRTIVAGRRIAGLRVHRGEVVGDAAWPALIDRATHQRVMALVGDPRRRRGGRPPTHLLTSLLRCGKCGSNLHHSRRRDGTRRYICGKTPGGSGCGRLAITAEQLEALVSEAVLEALDGPGLTAALAAEPSDCDTELIEQVQQLEQRLDQLAKDFYGAGLISRREYLSAQEELTSRLDQARRDLGAHTDQATLRSISRGLGGERLRDAWEAESTEWRRTLISTVVDHIDIRPGKPGTRRLDEGRVDLVWRA